MAGKSPEEHARNLDLRHGDFNDPEYLYEVYEVMRENAPFCHQDSPFVGPTPGVKSRDVVYEVVV